MYQPVVVVLQVCGLLLLALLTYRVLRLEIHVARFSKLICFKLSKELEEIDEQIHQHHEGGEVE